jgi:phosphoribosylformylglycinamidine synthase subunit PurL
MVGLLGSVKDKMTLDFKEEGDLVFLLGTSKADIASSEYLHKVRGVEFSPAPYFDLEEEARLHEKLALLIKKGLIRSAHDISEGGLFVTLAESAMPGALGFDVVASDYHIRKDAYWFGESQGRVVVSVSPDRVADFKTTLGDHPFEELGFVTGGSFEVDGMDWGFVGEWKEKYDEAIENFLKQEVEMA